MIKRSGFNVSPAEVEWVIQKLPAVAEVAVVPTPDTMREEAIVAYVVPDESVGPAPEPGEILAHCTEQLAAYKVPQVVKFVPELPRNFLGKLDRNALRERALEHRL